MAEPPVAGLSDEQLHERLSRLDELLGRIEALPGPTTDLALEAVESLTEVYGTALARVVAMLADGGATVARLAADDLLGHLMVLHGLHPDPVESRIAAALDAVRPELGPDGDVALAGIEDGVARVRVTVTGCQSSAGSLAASIGDVVLAAAPELAGVDPVSVAPRAEPALISVDSLLRRPVPQ